MRYALRNQDKIAAAYSSEYLKEHIIGSLDSYFNVPRSQEEVEDFIYSSCVCYSTNQGMNLEKLLPLRKVIWMLTDFIEKGKMQLT